MENEILFWLYSKFQFWKLWIDEELIVNVDLDIQWIGIRTLKSERKNSLKLKIVNDFVYDFFHKKLFIVYYVNLK